MYWLMYNTITEFIGYKDDLHITTVDRVKLFL